jgi:hypothetical protein
MVNGIIEIKSPNRPQSAYPSMYATFGSAFDQDLKWFIPLANVRNPEVAGVHNENDLNMLTRDC